MVSNNSNSAPIHCGDDVYIRPTYFVIKPQFTNSNRKYSARQKRNEKNLKDNNNKGLLSVKASSKMRNAINWMVVSAKYKAVYSKREKKSFWFKVSFVTLTIPPQSSEVVNEKKFQKCLNVFLVWARKTKQLHNYVWKVEASLDNRLHVHLTADIFLHYKDLKSAWNRILQREGLLNEHYNKFGNYTPNSTDVHSVRNVEDLSGYLCAYLDKKPNLPETFKGRIWGCSYSLSSSHKCQAFIEKYPKYKDVSFVDRPMIKYKAINTKPDLLGDFKQIAQMYMLKESHWQTEMDGVIKDAYNAHRQRIRDNTPKQPKEYLTIDFFGERTKPNYEFVNLAPENKIECEIEKITTKIGMTQLDLQF